MPKRCDIIITIPHAACPRRRDREHLCDYGAKEYAKGLRDALERQGRSVCLFVGREPRSRLDLNRPESRTHPWRERLRKALRSSPEAILIDMHSFPPDDFGDADVSVYDMPPGADDRFVRELRGAVARQGLSQAHAKGGEQNDIVMEAIGEGRKAALVEVNEKHRGRSGDIVRRLAEAMRRM